MQSNWQAKFFHGVALEFWRRAISPEQTRKEVDFLEKSLNIPPQGRVLDVPCGSGRHAIELGRRGHSVTGLDSSEESIAEAQASGVAGAEWVLADMCDLRWEAEFDGAYCSGNSFGYLNHEAARGFLAGIARSLKPKGRFVMDTGMVAESILPGLGNGRWHRLGDIYVISENRYHPAESRLDIDYTFIQDGKVETRPSTSYCFTAGELCRMQQAAGLHVVGLFDWYSDTPYQLGSRGMVIVSEKQ
jgi:SAM-dependent methyltransferase